MRVHSLSVPDISCGHCKTSIGGAVSVLPGVRRVEVDVGARTFGLTLDDHQVDLGAVVAAIEAQGYKVAPSG